MLITKRRLTDRLKELKMSRRELANRLNVTTMTLYNKFQNPDSFKVSELEKMVRIGFFKSVIIKDD
tara:strand:- start:1078 stop:1275 length:198 start_codon:yes stop_codon:yes gene_type:complete